jgi:hypothetical protein
MAGNKYIEKQKMLKFIDQVPFADDDRKNWQKELEENEVSETLLEEMHKKLMEIPEEKFNSDWLRMKYSTDLTKLIKQWRMGLASKQFKHGH